MNYRNLYLLAVAFGLVNPACAGSAFSSASEFSAVGGQSSASNSTDGNPNDGGQSSAGGQGTETNTVGGDTSIGGQSVSGNDNNGGTAAESSNLDGGMSSGGTAAASSQNDTGGSSTGGVQITGGKSSTGGLRSTGGKSSVGGKSSTGGTLSSGTSLSTVGGQSTGGSLQSSGGSQSTGGASSSSTEWICNIGRYGTGDGCDCGCGMIDPDCGGDPTLGACRSGNQVNACSRGGGWGVLSISYKDNSVCIVAPSGWTCAPSYYGDGTCHCGCGIKDSDCADQSKNSCVCGSPGSCAQYDWSSTCDAIDATDNARCIEKVPVPAAWTCLPNYYGTDDGCDCGCGVVDPDCGGADPILCDNCIGDGACSYFAGDCKVLSATDNSNCAGYTWTCDPATYGANDGCNCGCGLFDPDCATGESSACEYCGEHGSCARSCADIDPTSNFLCVGSSTGF